MNKHYTPDKGLNDEEAITEDGKYKYWRPLFQPGNVLVTGLFRRRYHCVCGKQFKHPATLELHYRKAYYEERTNNA